MKNISTTMLKDGDIIKGKSSANWESLFRKHAESGSLDIVMDNLGEITESVNKTISVGSILQTYGKIVIYKARLPERVWI